jgi:CheY-like chemotaxis protein
VRILVTLMRRRAMIALLAVAAALFGLAVSTVANVLEQRSAATEQAAGLARVAAQAPLLQSSPSPTRTYWLRATLRSLELSDRNVVSATVVDAGGHPVARVDAGSAVPVESAVPLPRSRAVVRGQVPGGGTVELSLAPVPVVRWPVLAESLAALVFLGAALLSARRLRAAWQGEGDALVHSTGNAELEDDDGATGAKILLVDDEESIRRYLGMVLAKAGYRVTVTGTPLEALRLCREGHVPDLLVTDIVLPTMTGHELASVVIGLHPEARALLMSSYADEGELVQPEARFLAKPFSAEDLLAAVSDALDTGSQRIAANA